MAGLVQGYHGLPTPSLPFAGRRAEAATARVPPALAILHFAARVWRSGSFRLGLVQNDA